MTNSNDFKNTLNGDDFNAVKDFFTTSSGVSYSADPSSNVTATVTEDYTHACQLVGIGQLVQQIVDDDTLLLVLNDNGYGKAVISHPAIFGQLRQLIEHDYSRLIQASFPIHRFNPYVELFLKHLTEVRQWQFKYHFSFSQSEREKQSLLDLLNDWIKGMRDEAQSPEFKKMINNANRLLTKNQNSLLSYIHRVFEQHARLLVLRVDFGYRLKPRCSVTQADLQTEYQQAKEDYQHFVNNQKGNRLFEHLVGHVWKLEYGLQKGFHYHLILFFDGSKVRQDITIAQQIGEYWQTIITQGRGLYFNCNAKQHRYKYRGIGMINHHDTELRSNLNKAATYLTKIDYFARLSAKGIQRNFGKGIIKRTNSQTNKRGRPRQRHAQQASGLSQAV